jgi:hypothetical protein
MRNHIFIYIFLSVAWFGCSKFDPAEKIPSYITIDKVDIETTAAQGSDITTAILDAWVYVNEELIGVFEIPFTIPVLKSGTSNIKILAGIKRNGMKDVGISYPFFNPYEIKANLEEGKILKLDPVFTYKTDATVWLEDFEGPGVKFTKTSRSDFDLTITSTPGEVYEGNKSAKVIFTADDNLFEVETDEAAFNNFNFGSTIYMELNYSTNYQLTLGIFTRKTNELVATQRAYINLFPSTETSTPKWKKIYIDLTEIIAPNTPAEGINVFMGIQYDKAQNATLPKAYFDNIKIVYL